ncbi:AGAP012066-PA-like protein [Gryllus bimaculatus]|nr:AGAP012066-PA-like protein [Gryllus bimaculatus]
MDGVGVISACSRGGGAQHQTPQRGQAHAVHPRPPPPSRGPPPPPLPPSPSTSTVAITTTTATTTTAAANAANTTNVTILITVTRVNTTAIVSSVSSDEQAGAVVSWKDTEAIDSIQVSFANAAMALKEEETDEMQKLVAEQKYVDKDFPLPDEHCLRPHELVGKPKMFVDGPSHMDIIQENLGDCWFLAAASVVAQHPELIHQVIPVDQPLYGKDYKGILIFRFWNVGKWTRVYIDDRLSVTKNKHLVYGKCTRKNEFWLPLLEKAFAKFHGGYPRIQGGFCDEAFLCLTGYICQRFFLKSAVKEKELFGTFTREIQNNSLIAVGAPEGDWKQGIPGRHAYSVTGVYTVRAGDNIVRLVRVRNPWGASAYTVEWKGAFSDNDPKWTGVDKETRKKLEYLKSQDGQFFMRMSNFLKHFPRIWFASPFPDFGDNYQTTSLQASCQQKGKSEQKNDMAPLYDVVIEVVQEQNRKEFGKQLYEICILVMKVGGKFPRKFTAETMEDFQECEGSKIPERSASVTTKLKLEPGNYLLIPGVMQTFISRQFLMHAEAVGYIQVTFANAAMPLKEEETEEMQALVAEQKYMDEDFPPPEERWMRPHELVENPKMFVDGPSHMDIIQENLGDCWFLAVATVVAQHPDLIYQTYLISSSWDADISTEDDFGREVFLKSPQYSLTVGESVQQKVNSEEENEIAPTYDVVIEVVQEQSRKEFGHQQYGICILVMKVGGKFPRKFTAETMDDFQFFKGSEEPERSSSVTSKLKLDSGDYLLIPAVMQTFKSRHFLMRIYSRKPIKVAAIERQ